jgi:hypothetical protein
MDTHSKGLTDVNLQVLDLKRASYGFFSASPSNKLAEERRHLCNRRALSLGRKVPNGLRRQAGFVRATLRSDPERRGWFAAEDFCKPLTAPEHKPALPSALSLRGRERGGWACVVCRKVLRKSFAEKSLLILTGFID